MAGGVGFFDNGGMRRIEVKQLEYDLTPVGGLALVGHLSEGDGAAVGQVGRSAAGAMRRGQQRHCSGLSRAAGARQERL